MNHPNIVGIIESGNNGYIKKPSGREMKDKVYMLLEYVENDLFSLCQKKSAMGEQVGRYFLKQLLDALSYMHKKKVVHRDIKLDNILIDKYMNMKLTDFGFATFSNIERLTSYKGTKTYMAPEIREHKTYDG